MTVTFVGVASVAQAYAICLGVRGNYDLSVHRTFHTIPTAWRESANYLLRYRDFGFKMGPDLPYDYGCSEAVNIVVTNETLAGSDANNFAVPFDGDGYVQNYGVTHIYGKCAGCAVPNVNKPEFRIDVGLWEKSRGRVASVHNCFYEMFVEPKIEAGSNLPNEYFFENTSPSFPRRYEQYFVDNYPFWEANGHCRLSNYWYQEADNAGIRPLSYSKVYKSMTQLLMTSAARRFGILST